MDRIVIIGSPGAGKTTLAQQLGQILDIQVFHLDRYFWRRGWREYTREERFEIQQKLTTDAEQWIMEGSYISSSTPRLDVADTIIFLDTLFLRCLWQVIQRHRLASHEARPDMPQGCTDRLRLVYLLKVLVFPWRGRNLLRRRIRKQRQSGRKEIYILRSHKQIQAFLQEKAAEHARKKALAAHTSQLEHIPVTPGV